MYKKQFLAQGNFHTKTHQQFQMSGNKTRKARNMKGNVIQLIHYHYHQEVIYHKAPIGLQG